MIEGTKQQEKFYNDTQELNSYVNFEETNVKELAKEELADINRILAREEFQIIDNAFENLFNKRKIEPYWYAPIPKGRNLKQIAKDVNRIPEYIFYYAKGSEVVHTSSYTDHIKLLKGKKVIIEPIRNLSEMDTLIRFAMGTAIHSYRIIITRYHPGELSNIAKKYKSDWQKYYLNIPSITYKTEKRIQP